MISKIIKALFVILTISFVQPSVHKQLSQVDLTEILSWDREQILINALAENDYLDFLEEISIQIEGEHFLIKPPKSEYKTRDGIAVLSSTKDLIQYGVYRVSYEWSLFRTANGQGLFHNLITQGAGGDTTPDGKQVFLFVGDSNADGRGTTIPTVASATLYKWNGTTIDEITTQTVANDGSYGSIWQYFATEYKSVHGFKTVGVFQGHSGAKFVHTTGDDFSTSGTYYATAVSAANAALANQGLTKLKAVVVNLGLNDISSAATLADIETAIDSFISRITADFPNTPILFIMPGQAATNDFANNRGYTIRDHLITTMNSNTNCHLFASGLAYAYISGAYNGDFIHYENVMLENLGKQLSRWFSNSSFTKWPRSVITAHYGDLSSPHKTLVSTFIESQLTSGNYFKLEQLGVWKTEVENNALFDWTFRGNFGYLTSFGFSANAYVGTNGSTTEIYTSYTNSIYTASGAGQNDFIFGVKLNTRTTANGTTAILFSRILTSAGTPGIRFGQTTTNTIYMANDGANQTGTESNMAAGNLYSVARNGGTRYLVKNKTVDASNADASDGVVNVPPFIGANKDGVAASNLKLNATYHYCFAAVYSTFNLTSFYDEMEVLIAAW